jgi:hypothetical protein
MHCHIRVRGHLDASWRHRFAGWQITHEESGISLLTGSLPDQAALYGVLLQIINLGIPLLSLETSEAPQQEKKGGAHGRRIRAPPND